MLASECEPWAKTGGLADVVDALARALGQMADGEVDDPDRRVPAALSGRPRAGHGRADDRGPGARPSIAVGHQRGDRPRRPGRRLSAAAGGPPGGLRPRRLLRRRGRRLPGQCLAVRAVLPGGPRGVDRGRAAGRCAASPRLAHGAGGHLPRRPVRERTGHRRCRDPDHAAQPRLPRLDAAFGARAARARAGRRRGARRRRRDRPPARGHRTGRAGQHGVARVRGRGPDSRVRDGARRHAARQGRPVHRDPERARHDGLGPCHRRRPRGRLFARGSDGQGGLSRGPSDPARVRRRPTLARSSG